MSKRNNNNSTQNTDSVETTEQNNQTGGGSSSSTSYALPQYLSAALRLPTSYPLGARSSDTAINDGGVAISEPNPIPGYMVLNYIPTLGVSDGPTSAVNRASFNQFNVIRAAISGNRPYEPADHMIYRACVDSMRQLYYYARRIYAIVRKYSATNLYRPSAALTAMGLNASDWIDNAARLYQWLLVHKQALQPFPTVPIGNITVRHLTYNTYMFSDGGIDSSQTYIMNQRGFWSYEVVDEVKGITTRIFPKTFDEFQDMWDEMYSALQNSSDVYIIAADIRRAFEDRCITDLPDTPVDLEVEYLEVDPVKKAVMNATILGCTDYDEDEAENIINFRIVDDGGVIKCSPYLLDNYSSGGYGTPIGSCKMLNHINCIEANPTEGEILSSMRLKLGVKVTNESANNTVFIQSMGTEVILNAKIVGFTSMGTILESPFATLTVYKYGSTDRVENSGIYDGLDSAATLCRQISNFDWHPPVLIAFADQAAHPDIPLSSISMLLEDIQNYVPVSDYNVKTVHEACLLAEFGF
uniref:Capsid protein n=1 Tax=Dromedary picobirnavirus TaxID=1574421 RepID=A0A0A1ENX4_9VIRU|nr:capsid protein [Dromedary picobirnavirus]